MKTRFFKFLVLPLLIYLVLFCGCDAENAGGIKTLTHPYVAEYECVEARLGDFDILPLYEYITINFKNTDEIEICAKPKGGEKQCATGSYTVEENTGELSCDLGILGHQFKQKVIIDNGEFSISKPIGDKLFFVKFRVK